MTVAAHTQPISLDLRSTPAAKSGRQPLAARFAFLVILGLMLLAFGASDALPMNLAATALFALAAWAIVTRPIEPALRPVIAVALTIAVLLALWVVVQSASSISSAPADGQAAIVPIMLPFAVFVLALVFWPTDGAARQLLQTIGIGGALLAAYGLAQLSLSPGKVLFVRPTPYRDSLTATLMSPDAASIVLGSILIFLAIRSTELIRRVMLREGSFRDVFRTLLYSGSALVTLAGLILTQSRVGIGATAVSLAVAMGLAAALPGSRRSSRNERHQLLKRIGMGISVGAITIVSVGLLAARTLAGGPSPGNAGSTCESAALSRMLGDHWLLGTGAGTFGSAAPAYADPTCGLSQTGVTEYSGFLEGWISLGLPFVAAVLGTILVLALVLARGLATRRRLRWAPITGIGVLITIAIGLVWMSAVYVPGVAALVAALVAPVCTICVIDGKHNEGGSS
jgi:hypothetical protein